LGGKDRLARGAFSRGALIEHPTGIFAEDLSDDFFMFGRIVELDAVA
jgi:hypothetical protein